MFLVLGLVVVGVEVCLVLLGLLLVFWVLFLELGCVLLLGCFSCLDFVGVFGVDEVVGFFCLCCWDFWCWFCWCTVLGLLVLLVFLGSDVENVYEISMKVLETNLFNSFYTLFLFFYKNIFYLYLFCHQIHSKTARRT